MTIIDRSEGLRPHHFPIHACSLTMHTTKMFALSRSLSRQYFPWCHPPVGFSFAEVPAGYLLCCRCTAELRLLNDEYIHQWHLPMHINWLASGNERVNIVKYNYHHRYSSTHFQSGRRRRRAWTLILDCVLTTSRSSWEHLARPEGSSSAQTLRCWSSAAVAPTTPACPTMSFSQSSHLLSNTYTNNISSAIKRRLDNEIHRKTTFLLD